MLDEIFYFVGAYRWIILAIVVLFALIGNGATESHLGILI